ncbi:hypothetical protein Tdes44962_MAKER09019 [Teratosphaeria destructans]|uniref:Uncharacterized protein n=1 Tax=Teratosphaeria destructans TaxID=418781 RepID=A0A9W7SUL7_9PEZI|nr:hypothetical protein Tdes44962_MAKER09019 [Teratosphaeria destructans]
MAAQQASSGSAKPAKKKAIKQEREPDVGKKSTKQELRKKAIKQKAEVKRKAVKQEAEGKQEVEVKQRKSTGDPTEFYEWASSLLYKLETATLKSVSGANRYIFTRLDGGKAYRAMAPGVSQGLGTGRSSRDPVLTVATFLERLQKQYGKVNTKAQVKSNLVRLEQGEDDSFADLYEKHVTYASHLEKKESSMVYGIKEKLNSKHGSKTNDGTVYRTLDALLKERDDETDPDAVIKQDEAIDLVRLGDGLEFPAIEAKVKRVAAGGVQSLCKRVRQRRNDSLDFNIQKILKVSQGLAGQGV